MKEYAMTVLIITIVVAWLVFSTLLVTIICMNSSRLSRIDEPFKDPVLVAKARRMEIEELANAQVTGLTMSAET
jgi:hypothetical protein